jgi:hypothetical protein
MKKMIVITGVILMLSNPWARADEGMWLPLLIERLNYRDMQAMGLQLTPEEIYSVNNSSLKDAIILFGRGCTGEVVSGQGLILTNHHCGYGAIQAHSSIDHDYLTDGFWAGNFSEELPNEGLTARFLIRIEDMSQRILSELNDQMTEPERDEKIRSLSRQIESEATKGTHYDAAVRSFYFGNEFYLFVFETFKDIRLVGAPPSSIGKFGADTDNWMWPRHTGDFSIFRVYTAPDGKPATYSADNIPLKPKYHLPISTDGVEQGDFAMILGYPGGTDRYLTSFGVDVAIRQNNPVIVHIREEKLAIMRQGMDTSDAIRIKYASKYARISNYWKYYIGQTKGLKRLGVADEKRALENEFSLWVQNTPGMQLKYGTLIPDLKEAYRELMPYDLFRIYYNETIARGSESIGLAQGYFELYKELSNEDPDQEKIGKLVVSLRVQNERYFKDYEADIDQKLLGAMLEMYWNDIPVTFHPQVLTGISLKYDCDFNAFAEMAFEKSIFVSKEKLDAFLNNPKSKAIAKDPLFNLAQSFQEYFTMTIAKVNATNEKLFKTRRLYMAGLREMQKDKVFYPDANATMRLTYGQVLDYYPADAVHFDFRTSLDGVMEKEDPSNWEFVVPEKLKELYEAKDYGIYGENGKMYTCFISNLDITGGNSGSPVLNGNGELIGLAFDGNWEAMSGDIAFEPGLQRTISVDIRYVLFIIDKYAGARNLIDEMTILKPERTLPPVKFVPPAKNDSKEVEE